MTDLLAAVAELTHMRNKDDLEVRLAQVIFHLTSAARLSLWRVVNDDEAEILRERVTLPEVTAPIPDIPLHEAPPEWRQCLSSRRFTYGDQGADRATAHLFPIYNDREITGLMEIVRPAQLEMIEEQLVSGLLRVYRNHLDLLDYGDRDELTGLLNRRTFDTFFKQVTTNYAHHAVVAVVDIDFFKRVNDQFGHPYGDEVLILMARLMYRYFLDRDGIFRFGGEEFLVILTGITLENARAMLESFREAVESAQFPQVGKVTVSIGLSLVLDDDTGAAAFGRADEALYVAKARGRNQVQCYEKLVTEGVLAGIKHSGGEMELF
ncbi:MAG TPA: GGDEF domain-containing protein [Acidocella sp.]|nr:MAG: hypothetical protein B7Z81_01445 [Acidocella sp. 20-61-6]HQT47328.1 GGDEF domain-containing protein [Acidocella sp.]